MASEKELERRREPFWAQVAPYVLALLGLITGITSWAISTQASQDIKIAAIEQHAKDSDEFVKTLLQEMKQDIKDIKRGIDDRRSRP
jgi:hypothetical protein